MTDTRTQALRNGRRSLLRAPSVALRRGPVALEGATRLDALAERLAKLLGPLTANQRLRDVLHGVWLGHPLHPMMVQVPVGAWTSAALLDLVPGQRRAATGLIAVGTVT